MAHRPARARLQDDRRLPPRQRRGDPQGVCPVHRAVPQAAALRARRSSPSTAASSRPSTHRDSNFTPGKLAAPHRADREPASSAIWLARRGRPAGGVAVAQDKAARLSEKDRGDARQGARAARTRRRGCEAAPDGQISLTDPDARAMATNMRGASVVGYNVQTAVETEHHLIVAHEVTNVVIDRALLAPMAAKARGSDRARTRSTCWPTAAISGASRFARAKRWGQRPTCPSPSPQGARPSGRYAKDDFVYLPAEDAYRCSAGETLPRRFSSVEQGRTMITYFSTRCGDARSRAGALPPRNGAFGAGSTRRWSTPCWRGSSTRPRR